MFDQSPYECRVEWGQRGAREAAERGDIVIIVDVLSFSSTVVTAVDYGAVMFPYPPPVNERARQYAQQLDAQIVWARPEATKYGGRSLSPHSFNRTDSGRRFIICSPNGAACTWIASKTPALLVGSLLNASSVSAAANKLSARLSVPVTVIPCGEKWTEPMANENSLRPGIEDYLGAGFILSKLDGRKSPEARVCVGAYEYSQPNIGQLIRDCGSGRELRERGYASDVEYCAQVDLIRTVPILQGPCFVRMI